ncbi:MAG: FMN-binding protein [Muribaculaceae bacterium]|nr:FMN-binding protein [Muribaculaceae bacterium]
MTKIKFAFLAVALVAAVVFAPNAMAKGKSGSPQVIYTGEIAKKVVGYNGPTPVNITISNGRITSITALDNKETPSYFNRAKEKVFKQFIGKTVDEAINLKADVASGATYSSEALIKNIKMGLQQAKDSSTSTNNKGNKKNKKGKGKRSMTK